MESFAIRVISECTISHMWRQLMKPRLGQRPEQLSLAVHREFGCWNSAANLQETLQMRPLIGSAHDCHHYHMKCSQCDPLVSDLSWHRYNMSYRNRTEIGLNWNRLSGFLARSGEVWEKPLSSPSSYDHLYSHGEASPLTQEFQTRSLDGRLTNEAMR